jgi:phosphotriesterase-related protein
VTAPPGSVPTYRGSIDASDLGVTLMHEHIFVRDLELERNGADPAWDGRAAVERAVAGLTELHGLGVGTVVDLTVIGLGRDVRLVEEVAGRVPVNLVAATGVYGGDALPLHYRLRGPGRLVDTPDALVDLFVRDIEEGIAGSGIRAGIIKVMSTEAVLSADAERLLRAGAAAHVRTGVAISTHSEPRTRNGLAQQDLLVASGVAPSRIIIGHCGDSVDLDYLRAIMDRGSTIGMDRFGMEHVLPDAVRVSTLASLAMSGYADRMVLSHDAAFYSHVTPPTWRARHAPRWDMRHLFMTVSPLLRAAGVTDADLQRMLVDNPARLLAPC